MKFKLVLAIFISVFVTAQSSLAKSELSAEEKLYGLYCGDISDLKAALLVPDNQNIPRKTVKQVIESRKPIQSILKTGKKGVNELLKAGVKNEVGNNWAVGSCAVVIQIQDLIKAKSCVDLQSKEIFADNGGIAACDKYLQTVDKID